MFCFIFFFFFKQKTAYEIVSRDWSSDVCSSDLAIEDKSVDDTTEDAEILEADPVEMPDDAAAEEADRKSVV